MAGKELQNILERVRTWPAEAQEEAFGYLQFIESELSEPYELTAEDKASIERGLDDAKNGRFASEAEMEELFARYRSP
jgi:predicted transcriptional regulator